MNKRIIMLIIVYWLIIAPLTSSLSASQRLIPQILSQGLSLYSAGNYQGAIDYLDQVVIMAPQHDQARYYLIFSYSMNGQPKKALKHAKILAKRFPKEIRYNSLVKSLEQKAYRPEPIEKNSPEELVADPIKTRRQDSTAKNHKLQQPSQLELAISMIDEENNASATSLLEKILNDDPTRARASHYMGLSLFNQGKYDQAVIYFAKALTHGHKNFETRFLAGICYLNLQVWEKAEYHFRQALILKDDLFCQMSLAEIYCRNHRFYEAEKILKIVKKSHPKIVDAEIWLAQVELGQGYPDLAAASIQKILAAHPGNPRAHFVKAKILIETQRYSEAADEAKLAMDSSPDNTEYQNCYALALIRNFNLKEGITQAKACLERDPTSVMAKLTLSEGLIMAGQVNEAKAQLQQLEKTSKQAEVCFLQASISVNKNDMVQARKFYEEYRRRAIKQPRALLKYARFLETHFSEKDSTKAYQEVIDRFGKTPFALEAKAAIKDMVHMNFIPSVPRIGKIPIPQLNNP